MRDPRRRILSPGEVGMVHRHTGGKTALIRIARDEDSVRTVAADQGKGMSSERLLEIQSHGSGVGIMGIRERIRQFRGEMKIESNGAGTSVMVTIPMPKQDPSADREPLRAAV
jgi:signal transduction histidine kinase